jgi:hypothetical protein
VLHESFGNGKARLVRLEGVTVFQIAQEVADAEMRPSETALPDGVARVLLR